MAKRQDNALANPNYIKDQTLRLLHEAPRLNAADLADYLGISPSGLSHAMVRATPLRRHARRIASFFHTTPEDITGLTSAQVAEHIPPANDPSKPGIKPGQSLPKRPRPVPEPERAWGSWLRHCRKGESGRYALRPGCAIERIEGEAGAPSVHVLLAPIDRHPTHRELSLVVTLDGRRLVRRYSVDEVDSNTVVLLPVKDGSALVLKRSSIREVRAVLATLDPATLE